MEKPDIQTLAALEGEALNANVTRRTDGRGSIAVHFTDAETGESLHSGLSALPPRYFPWCDVDRAIAWTKAQIGAK